MAIEGPLRELGIHDVFQLLDLSRKTGVLRVTSELRHNAGTVYFDGGTIIFAEIRTNPHPLGALLLRTGKITEADLERGRDMQERQGDKRRIGEILVALGAITPRELERQVRFQIEEVVFEMMSWREGYFSFTEGPLTDMATEATVRIPTEALLMEGARRLDEWSRIEGRVRHLGVVPTLAAPAAGEQGELDLLPPEWEMLAMVDGQRDLRTIAAELGRSDFEVAKTLFGLESAGLVVLVDPGTVKRERSTLTSDLAELVARAEDALERRELEPARALAEQAAGVHPHDPTVHLLLGRIELAAGRPAAGVDELRSALRLDPHLADAHDLYARILADKRDYERAFDEWDMTLRIAANHVGALKGLAFLYFKVGDVGQAVAHLEAARLHAPDDPGVAQALALAQGGGSGPARAAAAAAEELAPPAAAAAPLEESRVFAGLEGAQEGLLLLDAKGQVLGGALKEPHGRDVTEAVAAYLAGVSHEAGRTAKLLGLGRWTGVAAEGQHGHVHLTPPAGDALLLVVRDRAVPMGRLAIIAQRAAGAARRWLEQQA